mmetsp:Transcript_32003/g.56598  ORF Transcript_32003/g.56598 Transcript_32003/m.56598 type:complete len:331 (-) Transcript_32003:63-1055(-)
MSAEAEVTAADPTAAGNQPRGSASGAATGAAAAAGAGGEGGANGAGGSGGQRRRPRNQEVQEVVDELAQETKRVTLLEREEKQLKGKKNVSRLLFAFGVSDDRKLQSMIEQEFASWREKQEGAEDMTGVLLFLSQAAVHFLEGPTELLFRALELFHSFTQEVLPTPPVAAAPDGVKRPSNAKEATLPPAVPRPALISPVRVLYFTELHGVRTSVSWCSYVHSTKLQGGQQIVLEEGNSHELVFMLYKKMLMLCLRVQSGCEDEVDKERLKDHYGKFSDMFPILDEVMMLMSKSGAEFFFSYPEFEKVFMKPFHLVLHSELLWPMPPALSY